MAPPCTWLLSFDVAHPRRLRKLSRFLEQRSQRVQRSVFELVASPGVLVRLLAQATVPERFNPVLDSLRVYRICDTCQQQVRLCGVGPSLHTPRGPLVFP
ncbi:MAG: CRISPR-associated endonuclease Cas2 [Myxococcales bacterium]|nr:CRISPR-associated endonuclease Cas2 [Polyangiaceae bacterium]MDW8250200.1 CRISPR-associated endonuclease Cas2 [Myxococcales bacterium]